MLLYFQNIFLNAFAAWRLPLPDLLLSYRRRFLFCQVPYPQGTT